MSRLEEAEKQDRLKVLKDYMCYTIDKLENERKEYATELNRLINISSLDINDPIQDKISETTMIIDGQSYMINELNKSYECLEEWYDKYYGIEVVPACTLHNVKGEDNIYETHNIMGCSYDCENCTYFEENINE